MLQRLEILKRHFPGSFAAGFQVGFSFHSWAAVIDLKPAYILCCCTHWEVESNPPPQESDLALETCVAKRMQQRWCSQTLSAFPRKPHRVHLGLWEWGSQFLCQKSNCPQQPCCEKPEHLEVLKDETSMWRCSVWDWTRYFGGKSSSPSCPSTDQRWTTQPSPLLNSQNHDTNKTVFEATKFRRTVLHNNRLTEEMPFLKTSVWNWVKQGDRQWHARLPRDRRLLLVWMSWRRCVACRVLSFLGLYP